MTPEIPPEVMTTLRSIDWSLGVLVWLAIIWALVTGWRALSGQSKAVGQ